MNLNATLFGQAISFTIFVYICIKYVWPPLIAIIEERRKKIDESLALANNAQKKLDLSQEKSKKLLKQAKLEADVIIQKAEKHANEIIDYAKEKALLESKKIIENTQNDINIAKEQAKKQVLNDLLDLSVKGAEAIIKVKINKKENADLISKLTKQI